MPSVRSFNSLTRQVIERIGEHIIATPAMPDESHMLNWGVRQEEQVFRREPIPRYMLEVRRRNGIIEPSAQQERWIEKQWEYRTFGRWLLLNGEPFYITGKQWWELNATKIAKVGYPEFRQRDREWHMVWQHARSSPYIWALLYIKHRRDGFTNRSAASLLETVTAVPEAHVGIQADTEKGAERAYKMACSKFRELDWWWQPRIKGKPSEGKILYFGSKEKIAESDGDYNIRETGLGSSLDYRASTPTAYDGEYQTEHLDDEGGKLVECLWMDRAGIKKFCFYQGATKSGTMLAGTTMEEANIETIPQMEEAYYGSKLSTINPETGETQTGMICYFAPASNGLEGFIGRYGESHIEALSKKEQDWLIENEIMKPRPDHKMIERYYKKGMGALPYLQAQRADLQAKEWEKYVAYCRRYPLTEEECFRLTQQNAYVNTAKLNAALEGIRTYRVKNDANPWRTGFLDWENENVRNKVVFRDHEEGLFRFLRQPTTPNNVKPGPMVMRGLGQVQTWQPMLDREGTLGCDPFGREKRLREDRGSKGAIMGLLKPLATLDSADTFPRPSFDIMYWGKPEFMEQFSEDVVKLCHYTGRKINIEDNISDVTNRVRDRGYEPFLYRYHELKGIEATVGNWDKFGTHTDIAVKQEAFAELMALIDGKKGDGTAGIWGVKEYALEDDFRIFGLPELIDQTKAFSVYKSTPYDLVMAALMAIIAMVKVEKPIMIQAMELIQQERRTRQKSSGRGLGGLIRARKY